MPRLPLFHAAAPPPGSARLVGLAALVVVIVSVALALGLERLSVAADPRRQALAWSAGQAWALIVVGAIAGLLVLLVLRPRHPLLGAALGLALALSLSAFGVWRALPAAALDVPGCGVREPPTTGEWLVEARTLVDGDMRNTLTAEIANAGAGEPLLAGLFEELAAAPVEDVGIELLHGASVEARHCRALVSGSQVTRALPLLANPTEVGRDTLVPPELPIWRGDFDWWVGADGRLVGARLSVGGHPGDAWPVRGLRGQLLVELWPTWMMGE